MPSSKKLFNLPKEVMWRVLGFVDETHRAKCAAVARRWSHFGCRVPLVAGSRLAVGRRANIVRPIPNELLVGLIMQYLDEPDDGDGLRCIARVWSSYLAQTRLSVTATLSSSAAAMAADGSGSTLAGFGQGGPSLFSPLGISFGPAAEPGPQDKTGLLPNELLGSMFDFLDEDQTMNCATVARRWRASAMELILTSFLSPILWVIPQGAVQKICSNLHPNDISQGSIELDIKHLGELRHQVACVCQDWKQLASDVPTLAPGLVD